MVDYLLYGILGLGSGAVITFLAAGVLVGYRGSGVLNFAQGALGMYIAYVFYALRDSGEYLLPIPGLPGFVQVGPETGLGTAPAVAIALVTSAVLGLLMHFGIFRLLRNAPTLAKVVASIGLMLSLQSIIAYRFGTNTRRAPSFLPEATAFSIDGIRFPVDRLIVAAAAVAVTALLALLFRKTRFGLASRAASENELSAMLLGYSPDFQAGASWVLASLLAGVGGILIAPLTNLTPSGFTLLVVPALAACLAARFSSFGGIAAAGFAIGIAQNLVANFANRSEWLPNVGLPEALPFLVIIVLLFVGGRALPERGGTGGGRLQSVPPTRRRVAQPLAWFGVGCLVLLVVDAGYRLALVNTLIGAILCLSLVVVTGYVAQISLFQATLAGLSGYFLATITTNWGIPFPFSLLLAAAGATAVGVVAAVPSLRVRGVNLAVVTLAAGWAIEELYFKNPEYTGGARGASVIPAELFGLDLSFTSGRTIAQPAFGVMVLAVLTGLAVCVSNLRRSATGRHFLAVRTNERAAAALGIDVARTKLTAFAASAFLAGIAGSLMAYQQTNLSSSSFSVLISIGVLAAAFLGGITTISGSIVGGMLIAGGLFSHVFEELVLHRAQNGAELESLISGIALIVTAVLNPEGIVGAVRHMRGQVAAALGRRGSHADASSTANTPAATATGVAS